MSVVGFSPRMQHAGGFRDAPVLIQRVVAPIRIRPGAAADGESYGPVSTRTTLPAASPNPRCEHRARVSQRLLHAVSSTGRCNAILKLGSLKKQILPFVTCSLYGASVPL